MQLTRFFVVLLGILYTVSPVIGGDVCELCPVNNYCTNMSIYACPENQFSRLGSEYLTNCTSGTSTTTTTTTPDFTTSTPTPVFTTSTPTPVFTTTPEPETPSVSTVTFTATLLMSLAAFDSTKREAYVAGVAVALSLPTSSVTIGLVTENVARRRLLATTVDVETIVTVPSEDTGSVSTAVTPENLNSALEPAGMTTDGVSEPVVQAVVATTPVSIGETHEWVPVGC
jgi:hypothetical protein